MTIYNSKSGSTSGTTAVQQITTLLLQYTTVMFASMMFSYLLVSMWSAMYFLGSSFTVFVSGSTVYYFVTLIINQTSSAPDTLNGTNSSVFPNAGDKIMLDDEDEFTERSHWESVKTFVMTLYDVNIVMAIIQSVIGVLLFITIVDRSLRYKSQLWYVYHMIVITTFTGLVLHPVTYGGLTFDSAPFCYFVMYSAEYAFFGIGMNIILINVEIFFTKILTLQRWESNPFHRFTVLILAGWLVVLLVIAHLIINNNYGRGNQRFCFSLRDKSVREARILLRELVPAIVCFIFGVASIVTHFLKRSRITFTTTSGELKEIRTEGRDDESDWLRCLIYLDCVLLIRATAMLIVSYNSVITGPGSYRWMICLILIHVQSMYAFSLCLFFIADVRLALKNIGLKILRKASFGKLRLGDDLESLSVSFGNISEHS